MKKELIEKYLNNSCNEEELSTVLAWFDESAGTPEGKFLLFNIWEEMVDEEENHIMNLDSILHHIHHNVNLKKAEGLLNNTHHDLKKYRRRESFIKILTRVAAILLFPILCFGVYMSYKYETALHGQNMAKPVKYEVSCSFDALTKVALPDGSSVWLNHGSLLKYPSQFTGDTRLVELQGEGYFEVVHNPKKPFIVKSGEIEVLARGTTFNLSAYSGDDQIETSLINGIVELRRVKPGSKAELLSTLKPNDMTTYNKANHEVTSRIIEDDRYYSWKDGKLKFIKAPMSEVTRKLGRWFNADFKIKDPKLLELTFSATFVYEKLPEVLKLLSIASPINYTITEQKKLADGTFTKREVILRYIKK
jgi:transmembrane sensor